MAVVKVNGIQYSLTECKGDGHSGMVRARFSTLFGGSDARQREREKSLKIRIVSKRFLREKSRKPSSVDVCGGREDVEVINRLTVQ